MLFLDGVYVDGVNGSAARFRWVKASTRDEFTQLVHTIAQRVARFLERQGLLERDGENSYLASDPGEEDPMDQLLGHSILTSTNRQDSRYAQLQTAAKWSGTRMCTMKRAVNAAAPSK